MIIYYSGTGNSRYCAEYLGFTLDDEVVDAFKYMRSGIAPNFFSDEPWVFVSPTYCWRLPHIFEEFIRNATLRGERDAYFFLTCGSDIGNAGQYLEELCKEKNFRFKGVIPVVMPENYIAMFDAPTKEVAEKIVRIAKRPLRKGAHLIHTIRAFEPMKVNLLDKIKSGPVNPLFYKLFVKAKPFYATDACIGCKKCEKSCVMNNITVKEGKPVWGEKCNNWSSFRKNI